MKAPDALRRLRELLDPWPEGLRAEEDDWGGVALAVRRDMPHLDADAMHDRLHAWTLRRVERVLPHAHASVSFRHARPATPDEAELDMQEVWRGLEAVFCLPAEPPPTPEDLERFASLVPEFLQKVHGEGRPAGFRRVDVGTME